MAVEAWIDSIAALMAVSDGRGSQVRSYHAYDRAEFPEAITAYPCAITYVVGYRPEYASGGVVKGHYRGRTEFHLYPNVAKSNIPGLMLYFRRIRNAMSGAYQLAGLVDDFRLADGEPWPIRGPVTLQYGSEVEHHCIIVEWEVKAEESTDEGYIFAI